MGRLRLLEDFHGTHLNDSRLEVYPGNEVVGEGDEQFSGLRRG